MQNIQKTFFPCVFLHNTTDKNNLLVLNPFYMTTAFVFYSYATKDMSVIIEIIEIYKYVRSVWLQVQLEVHFHFPSPSPFPVR